MTDQASELLRLAEACERAARPDSELDTLIYAAINGWPVEWRGTALVRLTDFYPIGTIDPGEHNRWFSGHVGAPAYTASLDKAMTLVPDGCWAEGSLASPAALEVHSPMTYDPLGRGQATTPALALCSAALRARAALLRGEEG